MKLRWLPETWDDIERLFRFLEDKNPAAAKRVIDLIIQGADNLLDTPELGAPMNDNSRRRELYLPFGAGAYVLRYRLDGENIVIIRVWHSREHRG